MIPKWPYHRRVVDTELDELLGDLAAVTLEGAKAVGKTATATQRAATIYELDRDGVRELISADLDRVLSSPPPVLLDEWQRLPAIWDAVRRAVDEDPSSGRFLLTGSASPASPQTHSGAGRIVRLRMRPLSLVERDVATPTVSLARLLAGGRPVVDGSSGVRLERYVEEIVASGFPVSDCSETGAAGAYAAIHRRNTVGLRTLRPMSGKSRSTIRVKYPSSCARRARSPSSRIPGNPEATISST